MPEHPWGGSTPEMNASVLETGSTSMTWAAASTAWLGLAAATMATATITGAQMAQTLTTMSGVRSMLHNAATPPFLAWLGTMAGIAFKQAAICAVVAESYGMARSSMIPSVQAINNRVAEAAAEASNFFGQNTPLIGELNAEYGVYTTNNASIGSTYGEVIGAATLPVPIPPPPPLANTAKAAADAGQAANQAGQMVAQTGQGLSQTASQATSQASPGAGAGDMMGQMGQMFQAPMQAMQSLSGSNPMQSLSQLMSAPMSMFGSSSSMGSLLGGGPTGPSFSPLTTGTNGGLPLGSNGPGLGGPGGGLGGGLGGPASNLTRMGANNAGSSDRATVLSGVSTAVQERLGGVTATPMGSGGMPMGGTGAGAQSGQGRRASEATAAVLNYGPREESLRRRADGSERDLFT